ncbi:hypothetical protein C0993_001038 [Termitomyces sp. T159_Od127]|nr:hypothetical protein C0993_001038 [Termitomyces sp. T159_Od127]
MQSHYVIVEPCFGCPFRVEGIRFVPHHSYDDGLTLLFFHANGLHKETFTVLITRLLEIISPVKIHDIWAIGSAGEYAIAAYAFLSTTSHGADFHRRELIGIAHSAGATGLLMLQNAHPEIPFRGLILMDPGILPPGRSSSSKLAGIFHEIALSKPDTWTSVEEARRDLSRTYRGFAPATLEEFLVRHLPNQYTK